MQYFVGESNNAVSRDGTVPIRTASLKDIIRSVGGVKSIFSLFAECDPRGQSATLVALIELLTALVDGNASNTKDLLAQKGILVLSVLLQRVWSDYLSYDVVVAIKGLVKTMHVKVVGVQESVKSDRAAVIAEVYKYIFFNWNIWIHAKVRINYI